jgi:peptide alpha-N-acetyltransferase
MAWQETNQPFPRIVVLVFHLYAETFKYKINDVARGYYADGEDAYDMRCSFSEQKKEISD